MVYLLLLVLGLVLLVQSYLLVNLLQKQRELEQKVAQLARRKRPPGAKQPPRKQKNGEERGHRR